MQGLKQSFPVLTALTLILGITSPSFAVDDQGNPGHKHRRDQFAKNHPRRAEVLRRDKNIDNTIRADRGQLGGHYNQLSKEDRAIKRQEQRDARANGGHITKGEQRQLNREENHLNNQIKRDDTGTSH